MTQKRILTFFLIALQIIAITNPFLQNTQTAKALTTNEAALLTQAALAPINGTLRVNTKNGRYFMDKSGKLVYLSGSHFWDNLQDSGSTSQLPYLFNYSGWLDFLQANNHNFFRLWSWEQSMNVAESSASYTFTPLPYQRTGPGTALDGQPKFDLTKFNQAYFDRLRQRVLDAGNRGMYVSIMLFNGWSVDPKTPFGGGQNLPWQGHPFNVHNNINGINGDPNGDNSGIESETLSIPAITALQDAYVRKVVDSVNDLDNVLYEICNECADGSWQSSDSTQWQYHMVDLIHQYEAGKAKRHPVGMSQISANDASLLASKADWISIHDSGSLDSPYVATGSKVVVVDTDHVCGICGDRKWVWKSFTRGKNLLFMDQYDDSYKLNGGGYIQNNPNDVSLRQNLGYVLTYANRINLATMTPTSNTSLCSTGYCLRNAVASGAEYLAYLPNGGSININLSATSGSLTVEWFNPATGTATSAGKVNGGASRTLTAPFGGDAVLYLKSATVPSNDNFASAKSIGSIPYTDTINTIGAADTGDGPAVPGTCEGKSLRKGTKNVWYKFTPSSSRSVSFDTFGTDYNTYIAVWTGSNINSLSLVRCDDDTNGQQSQVTFTAQANVTYRIEVAQYNGTLNGSAITPTGGTLLFHATSFADAPGNYWAWRYVEGFYNKKITSGCNPSPLQYCPDLQVTRAEMAVFLLRAMHGSAFQPHPSQTNFFTDVPVTGKEWMQPWIEEFYLEGITAGCSSNPLQFCPELQVTRAEMAVFILRAKHGASYQPNPSQTGMFSDVPVAGKEWMEPWIEQFYLEGISTGCNSNPLQFCPELQVTRAEMAVFIDRAFGFAPLP